MPRLESNIIFGTLRQSFSRRKSFKSRDNEEYPNVRIEKVIARIINKIKFKEISLRRVVVPLIIGIEIIALGLLLFPSPCSQDPLS